MAEDEFVSIFVPYGVVMFNKPVRKTMASFTNVQFVAFHAGNVIKDHYFAKI